MRLPRRYTASKRTLRRARTFAVLISLSISVSCFLCAQMGSNVHTVQVLMSVCARVRACTLACLSGRHFSAADAGCGWLCRLRVRSPRQARRNLCRCRTRPRSHAHSQIAPGVSAVGAQFLNVSRSFLESLGSDVVDPLRRLTTRRAGSTRRDGLLGVGTRYGIFLGVTKHETV